MDAHESRRGAGNKKAFIALACAHFFAKSEPKVANNAQAASPPFDYDGPNPPPCVYRLQPFAPTAMKEYTSSDLKIFAVPGHASAGKTMLCEAMQACAGRIGRMGSIAAGTTVS